MFESRWLTDGCSSAQSKMNWMWLWNKIVSKTVMTPATHSVYVSEGCSMDYYDYDELTSLDPSFCTKTKLFWDFILVQKGQHCIN